MLRNTALAPTVFSNHQMSRPLRSAPVDPSIKERSGCNNDAGDSACHRRDRPVTEYGIAGIDATHGDERSLFFHRQ